MKIKDRVRANTADEVNEQIDREIRIAVNAYDGQSADAITTRIKKLDREWDIERTLETVASSLALTGVVLGAKANRKWLFVPGVVLPFLLQHAVQGWCPPLPVLRRLGVRTRKEIDREKYALKALRGDFKHTKNANAALEAAQV